MLIPINRLLLEAIDLQPVGKSRQTDKQSQHENDYNEIFHSSTVAMCE
jgi:hypothetical protein